MAHIGIAWRWLMVGLVLAAGISFAHGQEKTRAQQLADLEKEIQALILSSLPGGLEALLP